jgi:hypothetical protein
MRRLTDGRAMGRHLLSRVLPFLKYSRDFLSSAHKASDFSVFDSTLLFRISVIYVMYSDG